MAENKNFMHFKMLFCLYFYELVLSNLNKVNYHIQI